MRDILAIAASAHLSPGRELSGPLRVETARGSRTISIGPSTAAALKSWKHTQAADRLLMGAGWQNVDGLVVTLSDGSAPNPEAFSNLFHDLAKRAGLRPIRLHDVRHSYATAALADGVPVKVLSQRLGHADITVTLKVYAHVMPGDDEDAALRADALLDRELFDQSVTTGSKKAP